MGRATPIIIGVGEVINRSLEIENAIEPLHLMLQAIAKAIEDAGASWTADLRHQVDSIDVIQSWTWPYDDLPGLLAQNLGCNPHHKYYSPIGGNQPAKLLDEAARRISLRKSRLAIITGGEALASLNACAKTKKMPPPGWTKVGQSVESVFSPTKRELKESIGATHGIGAPIHVYPLFENGFRAHRKQSIADNNSESAQLYAEFAEVAASNPFAWSNGKPAETAESIGAVSKRNRMICFPYPLLMNAFNTVNLASACILTSTEYAEELGIPREKWIYPLGGAGTQESSNFFERRDFHSSPAISATIDKALEVSGLVKEQLDLLDFYSCFPIVPKLACEHLGLPFVDDSKPVTLLGGLTSFGGAGNNYSMHAIAQMVQRLRKGGGTNGLILANGGVMTYQHVICLSSQPRRDKVAYSAANPLPEVLDEYDVPKVEAQAEGEAIIETYTVEFDRSGRPSLGHIVGRLKSNDHRFVANHGDAETLMQLSSTSVEPIGRSGFVMKDSKSTGRNLFTLHKQAKL